MTTFTTTGNPVEQSGSLRCPNCSSTPDQNTLADKGPHSDSAERNGIQWRTKAEIAEHFHCHIRTITKYMSRRVLPFVKLGRWVRLDLAKCDAAMQKFERASKYDD